MTGIKKGTFATLGDRVMHQIRHDILCGEFEAGEKLVLSELKEKYQVGGTPLREAMVQLSWQKYVVMKPQKGFWVADVSLSELREILKARLAICSASLRDAIEEGGEEWELSILTAYHKLSRLDPTSPDFDYDEWEIRHKNFHVSLLTFPGAKFMTDLMEYVYDQQERYRHFLLRADFSPEQQYHDDGEHEAIMKAVLARDVELANELLGKHIERLYHMLEDLPQFKV